MPLTAPSFPERALHLAQPLSAFLELTYHCNWRCGFCYNPRHSDRSPLSADEWLTVLDDLRVLGTLSITLTGGEPLVRSDFMRIARGVRDRAFALRIFSNGSLITPKLAKEIAELQPLAVEVTLHGATAAVHDRTTAVSGSFDALLAAVRSLGDAGVRTIMKTPVTNLNEHQLDEMIALVEGLGLQYRLDATITPRDDGDRSPLAWAPSREAQRRVTAIGVQTRSAKLVERAADSPNCGLGRITMAIDPEGNVYPCIQWRRTAMGNVRDIPLRNLWHSSPDRQGAAAVSDAANEMLRQLGAPYSNFAYCPALAAEATGDPLKPDATFLARAEMTAEIVSKSDSPK